jgi:hypothetical protein
VGVGGALTGHAGLGPRLGLACMHSPEIVCFFVMSNQYSARCCSHAAPPGPNTPASHRDITLSDQACTHNPTGSQPSYKSFYSLRLSLGAYKVMYVTTPPPPPPPNNHTHCTPYSLFSHRDLTLLDQACTHDPTGAQPSYRELAFVGDAALWLLFCEHAFKTYGSTEDPIR